MRDPLTSTELDLLEQYAAGVLPETQQAQVHALLARRPDLADRVARIKHQLLHEVPAPVPVDHSWQQFRARVGMEGAITSGRDRTSHPSLPTHRAHRVSQRVVAWGATLAAAVVIGVVMFWPHGKRPAQNELSTMRQYATTVGQRATVILPDGAHVTLAPQTTLRVPQDFGRETRQVWLDGEAYFDVSHTQHTPFIVQTGAVHTRVLGTAFDVRHYAADRAVQVAVVTGKVAVTTTAAPDQAVTMTANRVSLVSDSTITTTTVSDMAPYTGWVDGRLTFDRTPVHDVLTAVGRWYGYEFHLTDSVLAARHLSASFDQQSPADMLAALQTVLNVTMTFDGHVVTLHPRHNSAAPANPRRHSTDFLPSLEVGR